MYFIELGINHVVGDEKLRYLYAAFLQQQQFSAYRPMWKLKMRCARGTPFVEKGNYDSHQRRGGHPQDGGRSEIGVLFLEIYLDPMREPSDAEALSCLTYQDKKHYYVVTRSAN